MEDKGKVINSGDGSMVDTTASDQNKTRASLVSRDSHSRSIAAIITGNKDRQSLHQALFGLLPQKPSKADETINTTKFGGETADGDTSQLNLTALHNMSNNSNDRTPPANVNQPLRKQAVVKFSFNDIKDKLTKIDNRDIGSLVRNRFLGTNLAMDDSDTLDKTEQTVKQELPKNTIVQFIEKFGFVELNEVDNILMADNNNSYQPEAVMLTPEQEADKPYTHLSVDPQGEDPEAVFLEMPSMALPEKTSWRAEKKKESVQFYDREPFSYGGERLIDSHIYLEDISDEPILETEIMNTINMLLDGQHSSIVCSYAISKHNHRTAIFGTETGEIVECIPGDQKNQVKKHSLDAKVTALALSPEDEYFVAGSNSSELLVKKTVGKMAKKYIKNLNQQKICQIIFSGSSSFIVSTILNVYHFSIVSYSLLLEVNMTAVVPRQPFAIMQLAPLDFEGVLRILVAMNDRVSLYALVKEEGKKESHVYKVGTDIEDAAVNIAPQNNKWPPSVQWIKPSPTAAVPCFIVFWKTKITLVEFHTTEYMISALREIPTYCVWGTLLDSRLLCIVNSQLEVELLSLERIFAPDYEKTTTHCKFPIFEGVFKDQRDIGYMTKYKDKLEEEELDLSMKLPFFQFFRNRLKEMDETIYMITDKGLMRYKLTSIEKLIDVYMIKNRHTAAIKMINNVFLGTVFVKDAEKSAIQDLAPQVVDSYMRQKMKDDLLVEDQAKLIDTAIECLVCSDNTEAVFEVVKSKFTPKLFWGEVSKFIREKIITNIPYDELANGAQYLDNEEVIELLTEFRIEATEDDDQIINRVLMIIKKKNIWPFLYKFCVFYPSQSIPTFLTMLAAEILTMDKNVRDTILDEAIFQSTDETDIDQYFEEPNRRLFFRLFWFFNLALSTGVLEKSLLHFTDEPETIERNIPDIYAKTLEWLLDSNNANIIIQTSSQMFFELILSCVLNIRLLRCPRVVEVIKKIKNVYLKKNQPVNDLRFVANFRATENLNFDPHPFTIAENILMILEDLLDDRYKRDIAFVAIKLLCFATHDRRFENQEWICYELITLVSEPFQHGRFWLDYRPIAQDKFEDLIIVASDNLENIKSIEAMQKQITNMAFEMKYIRVYVAMIGTDVKLMDIFKLFLKNTTEHNAGYLFDWIRKCIKDQSVDKADLTDEITKNIDRLVAWDREQVKDIVMKLPSLGHKLIIALEAFPELQLNYLERIMDRSRLPGESVNDTLKLKFLSLMCQLRPDRVVMALKSYIFPLEESLSICEQFKNLHGQAHIKSRTRAIDSALKIYMEIMRQSFDRYLEYSENVVQPEDSATEDVKIVLDRSKAKDFLADGLFAYQMIVEICKKELDELYDDGIKYFDLFINFIFDLYEELDRKELELESMNDEMQSRYVELRHFIKTELFDDFLIIFLTRVGTEGLIKIIRSRMPNARLKDFEALMQTLIHEKEVIEHISDNSRQDFYLSKSEILGQKKSSRSRFPDCSVCGNAMHGRALLTRCLHTVCLECAAPHFKELKDYKCPDCNTFELMLSKFYSCLAESSNFNIRAEAERIKQAEAVSSRDMRGRLKGKLDRLDAFDHVGHDMAKFNTKCENMIVSGNISSLFSKKR